MSWRSLLILGGIGSGRSEYAGSLVAGVDPLRRVAAGRGDDLARLAEELTAGKPDEVILVENIEDWLSTDAPAGGDEPGDLPAAVRACPARLVLVSPEAGLTAPPATGAKRTRALALAELNRVLADAVDAVVLLVAGQPVWLKGAGHTAGPAPALASAVFTVPTEQPLGLPDLKNLPVPYEAAKSAAAEHLSRLAPLRLGALEAVVTLAAGAQGTAPPAPWRGVRVLVLRGDHAGALAAGPSAAAERVAGLRDGTSPLAQLAGAAGAGIQLVEVAAAAAVEDGPALTEEAAEQALGYGWRLAEQAADEGIDAIVLSAVGDGADAAAAAVTAVLAPNAEPAGLLARVPTPDGKIDDLAWIRRCAAIRDAVHRVRSQSRTAARPILADLGGPDLATATGVILGAASRRTPVLVDGPVGAAAAVAARGLAAAARHWVMLPDHGGHPTVVRASETLGYTPLFDLRLALGEGAASLVALPLLRSALQLAATLPPTPPASPIKD